MLPIAKFQSLIVVLNKCQGGGRRGETRAKVNEEAEELTNEDDYGSQHTHRLSFLSACRGLSNTVTFRSGLWSWGAKLNTQSLCFPLVPGESGLFCQQRKKHLLHSLKGHAVSSEEPRSPELFSVESSLFLSFTAFPGYKQIYSLFFFL